MTFQGPRSRQIQLSLPSPKTKRDLENEQKKTSYNHLHLPTQDLPFLASGIVQFLLETIHSPRPWNVLCVCWDWRGETTAGGIIHKDKNVL